MSIFIPACPGYGWTQDGNDVIWGNLSYSLTVCEIHLFPSLIELRVLLDVW